MKSAVVALFFVLVAATPFASQREILHEEILRCEGVLGTWGTEANWSLVIQLFIIALGVLVATLQKFDGAKVKILVVIMGAAVSLGTAVAPVAFPVERARLKTAIIDGHRIVFEMKHTLEKLTETQSSDDREILQQEFMKRLAEFDAIERGVGSVPATFPGESSVDASAPGSPRGETAALYATGRARAEALRKARELALDDAIENLASEMQSVDSGWKEEPAVVLRAIATSQSEEVSSSPRYESSREAWDYTITLRMPEAATRWKLANALEAFTYARGIATFPRESAERVTVSVAAKDPGVAHFDFSFQISTGEGEPVKVQLVGLTTLAGGSSTGSQWLFDVFLNDKRILTLSERREYAGGLGGPAAEDPSLRGVLRTDAETLTLRVEGARARTLEAGF